MHGPASASASSTSLTRRSAAPQGAPAEDHPPALPAAPSASRALDGPPRTVAGGLGRPFRAPAAPLRRSNPVPPSSLTDPTPGIGPHAPGSPARALTTTPDVAHRTPPAPGAPSAGHAPSATDHAASPGPVRRATSGDRSGRASVAPAGLGPPLGEPPRPAAPRHPPAHAPDTATTTHLSRAASRSRAGGSAAPEPEDVAPDVPDRPAPAGAPARALAPRVVDAPPAQPHPLPDPPTRRRVDPPTAGRGDTAARAPQPPRTGGSRTAAHVPGTDGPDRAGAALDLVGRAPAGHRSAVARADQPHDDVVGEVVTATPEPGGPTSPGAAPAPADVDAPADLAGLADRLWDHLELRLRRSLLLERERRGVLPDL
ncbi:hypothetical protein Cph01nite_29130 [Cellulomonas phragmiteti]|uniref:Uncharacterized protein n=1 Tax=Cellulomonas phragmiteti TaxID=478780 RepID=A0ABQ4DQF0_9CELL|nr:hypothetical protein Cph01nite_29130 [Cellulomonas phragmiteti]